MEGPREGGPGSAWSRSDAVSFPTDEGRKVGHLHGSRQRRGAPQIPARVRGERTSWRSPSGQVAVAWVSEPALSQSNCQQCLLGKASWFAQSVMSPCLGVVSSAP